eukprot:NODE_109_length_3325_cov_81.209869_g101_i0.p1 GENE.NODE_109_length_3325_cov_81.209869_g101_i0~~NODE_109_length_3325_cov_81.209869_g101_i0.p1  ORF type:complete len:1009 (+),score=144.18 NODE_109_length_3325_cov_81.209869_g101_i0:94-3120(+)
MDYRLGSASWKDIKLSTLEIAPEESILREELLVLEQKAYLAVIYDFQEELRCRQSQGRPWHRLVCMAKATHRLAPDELELEELDCNLRFKDRDMIGYLLYCHPFLLHSLEGEEESVKQYYERSMKPAREYHSGYQILHLAMHTDRLFCERRMRVTQVVPEGKHGISAILRHACETAAVFVPLLKPVTLDVLKRGQEPLVAGIIDDEHRAIMCVKFITFDRINRHPKLGSQASYVYGLFTQHLIEMVLAQNGKLIGNGCEGDNWVLFPDALCAVNAARDIVRKMDQLRQEARVEKSQRGSAVAALYCTASVHWANPQMGHVGTSKGFLTILNNMMLATVRMLDALTQTREFTVVISSHLKEVLPKDSFDLVDLGTRPLPQYQDAVRGAWGMRGFVISEKDVRNCFDNIDTSPDPLLSRFVLPPASVIKEPASLTQILGPHLPGLAYKTDPGYSDSSFLFVHRHNQVSDEVRHVQGLCAFDASSSTMSFRTKSQVPVVEEVYRGGTMQYLLYVSELTEADPSATKATDLLKQLGGTLSRDVRDCIVYQPYTQCMKAPLQYHILQGPPGAVYKRYRRISGSRTHHRCTVLAIDSVSREEFEKERNVAACTVPLSPMYTLLAHVANVCMCSIPFIAPPVLRRMMESRRKAIPLPSSSPLSTAYQLHAVAMVIMLSNVADFQSDEERDIGNVVEALRLFLDASTTVIMKHNGEVTGYIGDAVSVYFPYLHGDTDEEAAPHAIEAAINVALQVTDMVNGLEVDGMPLVCGAAIAEGTLLVTTGGTVDSPMPMVLGRALRDAYWIAKCVSDVGHNVLVTKGVRELLNSEEAEQLVTCDEWAIGPKWDCELMELFTCVDSTDVDEELLDIASIYERNCRRLGCKPLNTILQTIECIDEPEMISLDFATNVLGPNGLRAIFPVLQYMTNVSELILCNNRIGSDLVQPLCDVVRHMPQLQLLDLSDNPLSDARHLKLLMKDRPDLTLYLERTNVLGGELRSIKAAAQAGLESIQAITG